MILIAAAASLLALIILITRFKLHPFLGLLAAAFIVGIGSGMPASKFSAALQAGLGNTLGFISVVLVLGTIIGRSLEGSGAADLLTRQLLRICGPARVHWAMLVIGFVVGLPVFFQVGLVMLVPIIRTVTRQARVPIMFAAIPTLASLSVAHGLIPPHPAALATVEIFHADLGKTILAGLVVALPTACIAGPLFALWHRRRGSIHVAADLLAAQSDLNAAQEINASAPAANSETAKTNETVGIPESTENAARWSLVAAVLPLPLIVLGSLADHVFETQDMAHQICKFLGDPVLALAIAACVPFFVSPRGASGSMKALAKACETSIPSIAGILLVIGAGGAYSKVLAESGVGKLVADHAQSLALSPLILGWLVAALIRIATGSATVAMLTAAGLVAPALQGSGTPPELMVLATGSGALMLSNVNDSGFWLVKESFGLDVKETLKTWTALETLIGICGICFTLVLQRLWY